MINRIRRYFRGRKERARFKKDFESFRAISSDKRTDLPISWNDRQIIYEDTAMTSFDTHYIYHPAWAARILAKNKPTLHIDISSTLYFSTIVSAFLPVHFYDYRPAHITLSDLSSEKADLLNLPFKTGSVMSISCMHVIEHIGLGRYGEPLDPNGDIRSMMELQRVTALGGTILFVVPIGKPRVVYNAHRIYSYEMILEYFSDCALKEFSLIPDDAITRGILSNASAAEADKQSYGCGCFWFVKK